MVASYLCQLLWEISFCFFSPHTVHLWFTAQRQVFVSRINIRACVCSRQIVLPARQELNFPVTLSWTSLLKIGYVVICWPFSMKTLGSIPDLSTTYLLWAKWHWDRIFFQYWGCILSVSFHVYPILIFILITFLSGEQAWKSLEPPRRQIERSRNPDLLRVRNSSETASGQMQVLWSDSKNISTFNPLNTELNPICQ
jgi:hypothetical protein